MFERSTRWLRVFAVGLGFVVALGAGVVWTASRLESLPLFVVGFVLLFVLSGIGNGSTYKMIPAIFNGMARAEIAEGADAPTARMRARRISGAVIGIAGAVGALGGVLINMALRQSFLTTKSGDPAFWSFLGFYAVCTAVTYLIYLRRDAVGAFRLRPVRVGA